MLSCVSWYAADVGAGHVYSHWTIPIWNALIRLGIFISTSVLLTALLEGLLVQRRMARTDSLTELCSRRAFDEGLQHDLAVAQRHKSALTLAYIDLDDFKAVNDSHGHAAGDRVLRTVGEVLRNAIREADTAARLGGR